MTLDQAPARYSFSVEEWRRMVEAGLFQPESHVELIDGEVFRIAAMGHPLEVQQLPGVALNLEALLGPG
ncbi:MAG: hypothetical protein ACRDY2_14030 [Acidimicrobiales bacterium]